MLFCRRLSHQIVILPCDAALDQVAPHVQGVRKQIVAAGMHQISIFSMASIVHCAGALSMNSVTPELIAS